MKDMDNKLYQGGYGRYQGYVVAKSKEAAIKALEEKFNINYLPFIATEITVEGYKITCLKEGEEIVGDEETGKTEDAGQNGEEDQEHTGGANDSKGSTGKARGSKSV